MYSSNSGVCPGSTQPAGLVMRATLISGRPGVHAANELLDPLRLVPGGLDDGRLLDVFVPWAEHTPGAPVAAAAAASRIMAAVSIDDWARTLWDYHHVGHALEKADCIIGLGSHDTRVAERGAELFLAGWAPLLLFSGHLGASRAGCGPGRRPRSSPTWPWAGASPATGS